MKILIITIAALSFISCTKKEVISQDLPDPSADLSAAPATPSSGSARASSDAPQACNKDADCGGTKCINKVCTTAH